MVPLFHACVVVIARSYTWRGSFLREALLKRMLLFGFCPRRCTPLASMARVFKSTWRKVHDFCWEETLQIMKEDWATQGWLVASVKILKSDSSYQVTVEYENTWPETGKKDHFTEVVWNAPFSTWKPVYVTVLSSPGDSLIIGWWYKEPSKAVGELDRSMRQTATSMKHPLLLLWLLETRSPPQLLRRRLKRSLCPIARRTALPAWKRSPSG